jgi:thioredoxin reductase (NADPH)
MSGVSEKEEKIHKVIIIGAGCAGLSAAIYCARAEMEPLVFAGNFEDKGGLLVKTSTVENYPGFPNGILGYDLVNNMEEQAKKYGASVINNDIINVDFASQPFTVMDNDGTKYLAQSIIIATGSKPNKLGIHKENDLWGKGISSCAVCDGALYKNKNIVVVGGGDSAMEEALFLTKFSNVTLIHRRDKFRASSLMQKRVLEHPKIKIIYNTAITALHENQEGTALSKITIKNLVNQEESELIVDGLFYGLGLKPNSQLFTSLLKDDEGYIMKQHNPHFETMTSTEGVFVSGDVSDKIYRQAVVACGDGCKAALDANNYVIRGTAPMSEGESKDTNMTCDQILSFVSNTLFQVNIP